MGIVIRNDFIGVSMTELKVVDSDKMLIIAPHPDDECIGCGGVLSKYSNQCKVIVMTDGSKGSFSEFPTKLIDIRRAEFENEMHLLGIEEYEYLKYPDGELLSHKNCMDNIDINEYDLVFLPWGEDNHPDHMATYDYAITKLEKERYKGRVYIYEVHVPFHDVDVYVDITRVIDIKIRLIQCHKSQINNICYDDKAKALAKYRACSHNNPNSYYECFREVNIKEKATDANNQIMRKQEQRIAKLSTQYLIMNSWLSKKIAEEKFIEDTLKALGCKTISIYGFTGMGQILYKELIKTNVTIKEILDRRELNNEIGDTPVVRPENGNRDVDIVIVTAITEYDDIRAYTKELGYKRIISLKQIIE